MNFINQLINDLISVIDYFGYWGVSFVVSLEYACFPLPSEVVLPMAGIVAANGKMTLVGAIIASVLGGLIGSLLCYMVGYFGGNSLISYLSRKYPKTKKSADLLTNYFNNHGKLTVFFTRLIPLTRTYVSIIAGATKLNLFSFIVYSLGGVILWNTVLISLGFYIGNNLDLINLIISRYTSVVFSILFIVLIGYFIYKYRKRALSKND